MGGDDSCCEIDATEEKENELHDYNLQGSARYYNEPLEASTTVSLNKMTERSPIKQSSGEVSYSVDKGKRVVQVSEVEHISERLKILEEEFMVMKQVLFSGMKERKELMYEIQQKLRLVLRFRNQGMEETTAERS